MADFTNQDRELLDTLRKMLEQAGKTSSARTPWQEHFGRDQTVDSNRATLAAKIVEGFSGSWAAQYEYSCGSLVEPSLVPQDADRQHVDPLGPPVPIRAKTNKIGRRGPPEINFVPYNWRTNTFGSKGPSLVGHPISFEVVGPTLKSPFTDWTWRVDQGAGPNGGDLLTPDVRPDGSASAFTSSLVNMYGPLLTTPWTIGDSAEPNGGLYLVVTDDGTGPGSLDTGGGQTPMTARLPFVDTAYYEIFRISEITATTFEVHPNKTFSTYFDLPISGTRWIRAIMVIKPYVARLAAIPQSGPETGREQSYVLVSPERAATSDLFPPFEGTPLSNDGSWLGGGFTNARAPGSDFADGDIDVYGGGVRLPIPIPITESRSTILRGTSVIPTTPVGLWRVDGPSAPFTLPVFGGRYPLVKVWSTWREQRVADLTMGSIENALGWFDVVTVTAVNDEAQTLARVPEADPQTGLIYFGPGPYLQSSLPYDVDVGMELYQEVADLWRDDFNIDKVEATRIKTLIDPRWAERFTKQVSDLGATPPPRGSGAGRPDKAIFATETAGLGFPEAANPGSLMDLGFRMVLFPAKVKADMAVPDFDRPIVSREVLIDASVTDEEQFVEIDYSAGIVRLSIPPPELSGAMPVADTDINPNGIVGLSGNNERGEIVLFAACVPYSMEDAQVGTGARITSHQGQDGADHDVSSAEVRAQIDTGDTIFTPGVAPYIGPSLLAPNPVEIVLDRLWEGPETGVVSITKGGSDSPSFGEWGYSNIRTVTAVGKQVTALGGVSCLLSCGDPTPATGEARSVVFRREAVFSRTSLALPVAADIAAADTTFGSSIRAETLRFRDCQTVYNQDGSVTINPRSPGFTWHQEGGWASSGIRDSVSTQRRFSDFGTLAGVYYQDQTNFNTGGFVSQQSSDAGQFGLFSSGAGAGDFRGLVTRNSLINLAHEFRLVFKFWLGEDGAAGSAVQVFVGLVGLADIAGPPPTNSLVQQALLPAPTPGYSFLGLRMNGTIPTASLEFFAQDRTVGPAGSIARPTNTTFAYFDPTGDNALYLVIESEAIRDPLYAGAHFVKMSLLDTQFRELKTVRYYDLEAVPRDDLEAVVGVRNGDGTGVKTFGLYYAKIVNHINLPVVAIP